MKEKKFTLKTKVGSWRVFALFIAIMLLFSFLSTAITTNFYKVQCTDVSIDVRGYDRTFELWRPVNVDNNTQLPCIIISHGGSESLGCTSLYAWEFARRGYVVINENMDGAAMSGMGNMDEAGNTYGSYTRVGTAGHLDVLNYARSLVYVDSTRIGMWGHSQGNGTMGTAVRLDGQYYTLNDRMLNVLYETYGIEITEDQLTENADDIAKEVLTEQQFGEYLVHKQEQQKIIDNYLVVARCAAANTKVMVAGHEVLRDAQMNMMPSVGSHESKGTWSPESLEKYKDTVRSEETPVINGIYAVADTSVNPEATGEYLGDIFEININNNPALAEAIANDSARFLNIPKTIHNGWLWGYQAVSSSIEWFTQCLGYNNGELSDPATQPISCKDLTVGYSALVCTTLAFFSLIGALMALASILVKAPYFEICASPCYEPKMKHKSKDMLIWILVTTFVGFVGTWCCSQNDLSFKTSIATMSFFMPWEPAQIRMLFNVAGTAIAGIVMFFLLSKLLKKKDGTEASLASIAELKLKAGWKRVLKTLLVGIILFATAYICAGFINTFFDTRFLHVDGAYELMPGYSFGRMIRYFIIYLPFCVVVSTLNNMVTIKGVSDTKDTVINVIVTSLGMVVFMVIGFAVTYSTPGQAEIFRIHAMLSMIFITPYCNYIYRKMYKITGSVWAGAVLVALFMAWRAAGYISHRFMWVGNNELAAFWGLRPF